VKFKGLRVVLGRRIVADAGSVFFDDTAMSGRRTSVAVIAASLAIVVTTLGVKTT